MGKKQHDVEALVKRLSAHPELMEEIEQLLEEVDDPNSELANADDAEDAIAEGIHQIARRALTGWAQGKANKAVPGASARRGGKKNSAG
jgi:hypothetical protein